MAPTNNEVDERHVAGEGRVVDRNGESTTSTPGATSQSSSMAPAPPSSTPPPPPPHRRKQPQKVQPLPNARSSLPNSDTRAVGDDEEAAGAPRLPKRTISAPPTSTMAEDLAQRSFRQKQKRVSLPSMPKQRSSLQLRRQPLDSRLNSIVESMIAGEGSLLEDVDEKDELTEVVVEDDDGGPQNDKQQQQEEPSSPRPPKRSISLAHSTHRHRFAGSSNTTMDDEDQFGRSCQLEQPQLTRVKSNSGKESRRRYGGYLYMLLFNNPNLLLRRQLLLSFGTITFLMITFVIVASSVVTLKASRTIMAIHQESLRELWIDNVQIKSARYLSDLLTSQLLPYDIVQIMYEATRDRYAGYPNVQSNTRTTNFDEHVPFMDYYTKERRYPIQGPRVLLDWESPSSSALHHEKYGARDHETVTSTPSGVYGMQGMCDPAMNDDPTSPTYYPNCTPLNNNILTGGIVQPTARNKMIYEKSRDLVPLLKSLYEYHNDTVSELGIYFRNDGAGSFLSYPHFQLNSSSTYRSDGCDWMVNTLNPLKKFKLSNNSSTTHDIPTLGTFEEARRCHEEGAEVSSRNYNPMERGWCQRQATADPKTKRILLEGPFVDAWDNDRRFLSAGRAVYDRITDEFIACLYVGFSLSSIGDTITKYIAGGQIEAFEVSVVKLDAFGTVLASTASTNSSLPEDDIFRKSNTDTDPDTIDRYDVGVSMESFHELRSLAQFDGEWDPNEVETLFETNILERDGFKTVSYPIPPVPPVYDEHYVPECLVVVSLREEVYQEQAKEVDDDIQDHSRRAIVVSIVVGACGFLAILMMISLTSHTITVPLASMNRTAKQIVESFGENRDGSTPPGVTNSSRSVTDEKRNSTTDRTAASFSTSPGLGRRLSTTDLMPKILKRKSSKVPNDAKYYILSLFRQIIPKTELGEMKEEFNKMVVSFSGRSMMAKSTKQSLYDVMNTFDLLRDDEFLRDLYKSRQDDKTFPYQLPVQISDFRRSSSKTASDLYDSGFSHLGPIIAEADTLPIANEDPDSEEKSLISSSSYEQRHKNRFKSPLFVSILFMIVLPLIVIIACIAVIVIHRISAEFFKNLENAQASYIEVEMNALQFYASVRAKWAAIDTAVAVRDAFLMTRYLSWLLFGGLSRTESFTDLVSGIEECKYSDTIEDCDFYKDNFVCDCDWHDTSVEEGVCRNYEDIDSRYLQRSAFACQSDDVDANGDRYNTSFPNVATSPSSTGWWSDVDELPGSEKGSSAAGYETTYARLRVASSVPLYQVLYNYDEFKSHALGAFVGFEADGLHVGFNGCRVAKNSFRSLWKSSESNGAERLRPELCPEGKHGYDPRCQEWYHTARNLSIDKGYGVYVAPPFFGTTGVYEQSASSPLVDPATGAYVGTVLITFKSDRVTLALKNYTKLAKDGFPILITPQPNQFGKAETVIGPGLSLKEESKPIVPLVLPDDYGCTSTECKSHIGEFEAIVNEMKEGKQDIAHFTRRTADGGSEVVYIAYSPVYVKSFKPINATDFAEGVEGSDYMVYSLALAETRRGLLEPFDKVEDETRRQIFIAASIAGVFIFVALCCVMYISDQLTYSLSKPTTSLLRLARRINRLELDDPPKLDRTGSKEIRRFSTTMETLYKVVKVVNAAYFQGDLEKAYAVLSDALRLFKRLDNRKAVGVASNNLGNVMLAMYRRMKSTSEKMICGLTMNSIISRGLKYYLDAIRLGEAAYDDFYEGEGWTPKCLDFMQHLSNRYFNRAIFLLTVKDSHESPEELETLGLRDLQISQDMDVEIIDQGEETGWGRFNRAEALFETALTRARGYISLEGLNYDHGEYIEEILDGAFDLVKKEIKKLDSDLFSEIRPMGRLQQVETELVRYHMLKSNYKMAAKVGIRMLLEDEYIFPLANREAVSALVGYLASPELRQDSSIGNGSSSFGRQQQQKQKRLSEQLEKYEFDLLERLEQRTQKQKASVSAIEDDLEVASKSYSVQFSKPFSMRDDMSHTSRGEGGDGRSASGDFTIESMVDMFDCYREDVTMEVF